MLPHLDAIGAVSAALQALLDTACSNAEFPLAVTLNPLADIPALTGDGIAIALLSVEPAPRSNAVPQREATGARHTPSIALDLVYLLAPRGVSVEIQQHLLARAILAITETPVLTAAALNANRLGRPVFAPEATIACALTPLAELLPPGMLLPPAIALRASGLVLQGPPNAAAPPVVTRWPQS